jgi:DNA-binding transcriptional ArsR family regulator
VNPDQLSEVLSSRVRLKIEDALSLRPRTLNELASITGISVQGVLRHLNRLEELDLVEERKVSAKSPKARRVYAAKGATFGDYSTGSLTVVKATEKWPSDKRNQREGQNLEKMAGELLIQRRAIRDGAKRLGRMIDGLADDQEALASTLEAMRLSDEERLILEVLLTEETLEEGIRVLSRYYGFEDRRSMDTARKYGIGSYKRAKR